MVAAFWKLVQRNENLGRSRNQVPDQGVELSGPQRGKKRKRHIAVTDVNYWIKKRIYEVTQRAKTQTRS